MAQARQCFLGNEYCKVLLDLNIQTCHVIEVCEDKRGNKRLQFQTAGRNKTCKITGFTVPGGSRIEDNEKEKNEKN